MGYTIEYDPCGAKYEVRRTHPLRFTVLLICAVGLFLILTLNFWPEGWKILRSVLIPGEDFITLQAIMNMIHSLKAGAPVTAALEAFCIEVIRSGYGAG